MVWCIIMCYSLLLPCFIMVVITLVTSKNYSFEINAQNKIFRKYYPKISKSTFLETLLIYFTLDIAAWCVFKTTVASEAQISLPSLILQMKTQYTGLKWLAGDHTGGGALTQWNEETALSLLVVSGFHRQRWMEVVENKDNAAPIWWSSMIIKHLSFYNWSSDC